jgi:iron complex outermembrane recepter protein
MFKRTKLCSGLMLAFGGTLALGVSPSFAQQQLERVEITGSSIKRIDAETALPVTIVTREEIARSGVTSTEQLLQSISAVSSQGGISNATGAGVSTYGQASVSLRGLGEDRTLVLVNGRRLVPFAAGNGASVNINAIPVAAIERVEVLKDGASGVYGSDAIAGVINFILTRDFQGIELGATYGQPTRSGGGKNTRVTIVGGFGDVSKDRFNITLSAALEKETLLFAKDREFAKTGNIPPFIQAAATGQGNIQGSYTPGTGLPAAGETGVPGPGFGNSAFGNPLGPNNCGAVNMFHSGTNAIGAPICLFDSNAFVGLIPERELTNLSGNLVFKLTDSVELFGDALYSKSKVTQEFQPNPIRRSFLQTDSAFAAQGVDPVLLIRPNNPNYATAVAYLNAQEAAFPGKGYAALIGQPLAVTARVFDFGPRVQADTSTQTRVVGGIRGTVLNQDYEVAVASNSNNVKGTVGKGFFSQVAFSRVVNDPNSDYNPWSLTQSAAFNNALAAGGVKYEGKTQDSKYTTNAIDGKVSGEITKLPAGPLQYATGLQYREERVTLDPSAALLSGDITGLGGASLPVDQKRKVGSAFGELVIPIVKGLEGNTAIRYDKYSKVGNSSSYKAALRWEPVKEAVIRGSLGTGFRAPTLIDLYSPLVLGTSEQFNDPVTGTNDLQVNSFTGGFVDLKPEKSRQRSIGIVLQPTASFNASIDLFNIRVSDIISTESAQAVVSRNASGDPSYASLVTRNSSGEIETITQVLRNVGEANVTGIDLQMGLRQNFDAGRLDVNLSGTYMIKFDQTSPSGALSQKVGTIVDPNGDPVLSTSGVQDGVVLRWKHLLSATWTQGPWALTFAQNYYRGYRDGNDLDGNPHSVPDQALYDANVAFSGVKNLKLAVGVKNLFNKNPPIFIPTSNQFQGGYDVSQYDPRARFVYFSANYKF